MTEATRRERKKADVRSQLISTAIDLFSRIGIEATTIEHIASAADVGKGTVYNYFRSKEEIIVAFLAEIEEQVQHRLLDFNSFAGDVDDILCEFVLLQFQLKAPHHKFIGAFLGQMFRQSENLLPYLPKMQKSIDLPLELLFRTLRERGMIRQDIDPLELILAFRTLHFGLTGLWSMEGPPFTQTEKVLRLQMKLFSEGLKAGQAYEV